VIFIKLSAEYLKKKLIKIVLEPECIKNPYHIVHYWEIYKSFSKFEYTELSSTNFNKGYFHFTMMAAHLLKPSFVGKEQDLSTKEGEYMIKKRFFEKNMELLKDFMKRYPQDSWLAELALGKLYTKQESSCALASHIVTKNMNKNLLDKTSVLLIKLKVLSKLGLRLDHSQKETAQIKNFIHVQDEYKKLKKNMIQGINSHIEFWKTFTSSKPNLLQMIRLAQKNVISSKKLRVIASQCRDFKKMLFSEPLLTCSLYCYFFQDQSLLAGNLLKEYFQTEHQITDLYNKSENTVQNPRFTSDALYLIVSSQLSKLGEILDCSGKINAILGYPKEILIGKSINVLVPPLYSKSPDYFLKTSDENTLNKTRTISISDQEGYIRTAIINISLAYLQDYELCYNIILEPVKDDTRLVIIESNGAISGCSENFTKDLDFQKYHKEDDKDKFNIKEICPNFLNIISKKSQKHFLALSPSSQEESSPSTSAKDTSHQSPITKDIELSFFPFCLSG